MRVVEYLRNTENGLQKLNDEYGVIVKQYPEGLIVLNYDQINSPKQDDMVKECRGLILDNEFNVVSRSFDRFFNYGECGATFNPKTAVAYEKVDGSLIKIYNWNDTWYVSTRGTAFAESQVNGFPLTFKDMVFNAILCNEETFQDCCNYFLDPSCTYICEVTGVENRVVTRYHDYSLWLLAIRGNNTGDLHPSDSIKMPNIRVPKKFKFNSVEECVNTVNGLPDLQEGYVIYENGTPVCKVKSPAYVACHLIRGNGVTPKSIATLIVTSQDEEYLSYYWEDTGKFQPYWWRLSHALSKAQELYDDYCAVENQKEFALGVKSSPTAFILFKARRDKEHNIHKVFNSFDESTKVKFLLSLMED